MEQCYYYLQHLAGLPFHFKGAALYLSLTVISVLTELSQQVLVRLKKTTKYGASQGPQRMNPTDFGDTLNSSQVPL